MTPEPSAPSWEKLGAPMTVGHGAHEVVITAEMLRAAAASFSERVPVEAEPGRPRESALWGWVERVEMRGDELWGEVRWSSALRPTWGLAVVLQLARDAATGPRLIGAFPRSPEPAIEVR